MFGDFFAHKEHEDNTDGFRNGFSIDKIIKNMLSFVVFKLEKVGKVKPYFGDRLETGNIFVFENLVILVDMVFDCR